MCGCSHLPEGLHVSQYSGRNPPVMQLLTETNGSYVQSGITRLPVLDGEVSHIEIPRTAPNLGIAIVGGADSALRCIVIQEVFPKGLVAQDGRLKPGDQLVEINGVDMSTATHYEAYDALKKVKCQVLRLGVYREKIATVYNPPRFDQCDNVSVTLKRKPPFGFGFLTCEGFGELGVFISFIMEGSPAYRSDLQLGDRVMFINNEDVSNKDREYINKLFQKYEKVNIIVARKRSEDTYNLPTSAPSSLNSNAFYQPKTTLGNKSKSCDSLNNYFNLGSGPLFMIGYEELPKRIVTITKQADEHLGMRIGGGMCSNEGHIPIYVANIQPQSCIGKTHQIWKGDILLEVNDNSLLGLTHSMAVDSLKAATFESTSIKMTLMSGSETSTGTHNFIPSWLFWQNLPRCLQFTRSVTLCRTPGTSLGFSIVGGEDPTHGAQHIHILFVVQDSPADKDGRLKCGDRILSVNGQMLENVEHSRVVNMLKKAGTKVDLEVISWLGTEL